MNKRNDILLEFIGQEMDRFGYVTYTIVPYFLPVLNRNTLIDLGNDYLFLDSSEIKLPEFALLEISSGYNYVALMEGMYEKFNYFRYQSFKDFLHIQLTVKGNFTPFLLEFIKVVPTLKREKS